LKGRVEGWDISDNIIQFAEENLSKFPTLKSCITLKVQNALYAEMTPSYDRVYVGAGTTSQQKKKFLSLLKDRGIMIVCIVLVSL
jgi:protein-L-isoaspartate O-methyltransferase